MEDSLEELAKKFGKLPRAVAERGNNALTARAQVTKKTILAAAETKTRGVKPNWVQYRIRGDTAAVILRGGFAYLTEKGSYKQPDGWDEGPKSVTNRRIRNAAKKGITLTEKHAVLTPEGPRASVHHPKLRARPFWDIGIEASRIPGRRAYEKSVSDAITSVFH